MNGTLRKLINKRVSPTFYTDEVNPERIIASKKEIGRILGSVGERVPEEYSLIRSYEAIRDYYRLHNHLGGLKKKYIRHIPYLIFDSLKEISNDARLEDMRGFLDAYVTVHKGNWGQNYVHSLLQRLIVDYPDYEKFKKLYDLAIFMVTRGCSTYRCEQYREMHSHYEVFQPSGLSKVWQVFCDAKGGVEERLLDLNLPVTLDFQQTSFFDAVVESGIEDIKASLTQRSSEAEQKIAVLSVLGFKDGGRYGLLRTKLIDALLLPFMHSPPNKSIKHKIKHFLLSTYGDPRITGGKQWHGVGRNAHRVILSWLVEDVLEDFFKLFSYVAERDSKVMNHWKYREPFWRAYLAKGHIKEAWIAFGNKMDKAALNQMSLSAENYGRFVDQTGLDHNHAALIMRIDDLIVTDWNHNGKYSVWKDGETDSKYPAPEPYQKVYLSKAQLHLGSELSGNHMSSSSGSWQKKLSDGIQQLSGSDIRITKQDYSLASGIAQRGKKTTRKVYTASPGGSQGSSTVGNGEMHSSIQPRLKPKSKHAIDRVNVSKIRRGKKDTGGLY